MATLAQLQARADRKTAARRAENERLGLDPNEYQFAPVVKKDASGNEIAAGRNVRALPFAAGPTQEHPGAPIGPRVEIGPGQYISAAEARRRFPRADSGGFTPPTPGRMRLMDAPNPYPYAGDYMQTEGPGTNEAGRQNAHTGRDYAFPANTPVPSAKPGQVIHAGNTGDFGYTVVVAHEDGTQTQYSHLQPGSIRVGQRVEAGQPVGVSGQTGKGTGPHLHYEENPLGAGIGYNSGTGRSAYPLAGGGAAPKMRAPLPDPEDEGYEGEGSGAPKGWTAFKGDDGQTYYRDNRTGRAYNPATGEMELPTGQWAKTMPSGSDRAPYVLGANGKPIRLDPVTGQPIPGQGPMGTTGPTSTTGYIQLPDGQWVRDPSYQAAMTPEEQERLGIARGGLDLNEREFDYRRGNDARNRDVQVGGMTGYWNGAPTLPRDQFEAGATGYYGGAPTMAREQWEGQFGLNRRQQDASEQQQSWMQAKDTRDFENAEAWRSRNFGEDTRRFDQNFGLNEANTTGYYNNAPTLARDRFGLEGELGRGRLDLDRFAAERRMQEDERNFANAEAWRSRNFGEDTRRFDTTFGEGQRQFDTRHALDRDRFGLESRLGEGRLDLDRDRFGLEGELGRGNLALGNRRVDLEGELGRGGLDLQRERFAYERAQNPYSFIEQTYNARGLTPPTAGGQPGAARLSGQEMVTSEYAPPGLRSTFQAPTAGGPAPATAPQPGRLAAISNQAAARLLPSERRGLMAAVQASGVNPEDYQEQSQRLSATRAAPKAAVRTIGRRY